MLDWYKNTPGIVSESCPGKKCELIKMFKCREDPLTRTKQIESRVWKMGERFLTNFQDEIKRLNKLDTSKELSVSNILSRGFRISF